MKPTRKKHKPQKSNTSLPLLIAVLGVIILAVAAWAAFRSSASKPGTASLVADKEEVNLGNVKLGEVVSTSFKLTNTGTKMITLKAKPYIEVLEGC